MKKIFGLLFLTCSILISSCEKDEGNLPTIIFNTTGDNISTDCSKSKGSDLHFSIIAAKAEEKDVLKKFNISKSVNGGAAESLLSKDLTGTEGDNYYYDFHTTLDTIVGQKNTYTFTVTNRDGLVNQVSSTVTIIQ